MRVDIFSTSKKYRVIYADPPWKFGSKEPTGKARGRADYTPLEAVYPTEKTSVMSSWDVGRIAEHDAALFMWATDAHIKDAIRLYEAWDVGRIAEHDAALFMLATDAHIKDAIRLYEAWGFQYVTVAFVWLKKTVNGEIVCNLAPWTLKNCELCLFGTRGHMVQYKQKNNIPQFVEAVRRRHSEKPEEVRRRIEELFGDVPRIELFARRRVPGWDCWGNEV